jgi:hypothetical protein
MVAFRARGPFPEENLLGLNFSCEGESGPGSDDELRGTTVPSVSSREHLNSVLETHFRMPVM